MKHPFSCPVVTMPYKVTLIYAQPAETPQDKPKSISNGLPYRLKIDQAQDQG